MDHPDEAVRAEVRYWEHVSVEERVSAVETLREVTLGVYDEAAPRLERVYRLDVLPPRALPRRRGPRRRGER